MRTTETDGDIDSMETRWVVWNDGARSGEQQNSFKINMVGAADTTALAINTNRRIGFGTDTPEHPPTFIEMMQYLLVLKTRNCKCWN